jgi:FKBP-type peptidyl-prolyl cis-trans isomerase (trigger factor)
MITSTTKDLPKSTVEINITITWDEVSQTYTKIFEQVVKDTELPGFRKGKAPRKLVEEKIDKTKVYEQVVREIIPKAYSKAIQEQKLQPIINPKVEVIKAKENEEWVVKTTIAVRPKVALNDYKEKVKELIKGKTKIWTPDDKGKKDEVKKPPLEEIINVLINTATLEISDLLITDEANRMLSNLIDQTQKLGMSVEQYLLAKGKTTESVRAEYAKQAEDNLKIEFILNEIADEENITVANEDIEKLIEKTEKPEDKENMRKQSYYLAHLLRQQKTFDYLNSL